MESVKPTSWDESHYNLWFKAKVFDEKIKVFNDGIKLHYHWTLKMTIKIKMDKYKTDLIEDIDCSI